MGKSCREGYCRPLIVERGVDHFRNNTLAEGSLLPIDRLAQFPPISLRHAATRSARISTPAPPPRRRSIDASTLHLLLSALPRAQALLACRRSLRKFLFFFSIRKNMLTLFVTRGREEVIVNLFRFSRKMMMMMMMLLFIFGGNLFNADGESRINFANDRVCFSSPNNVSSIYV